MALILLIEDEKVLRENLHELLEMHGYPCISTAFGTEAISLLQQFHPDLILCDISLPDKNGYQVKMELNASKSLHNPPFIFLTARNDKEDYEKAMQLGAVDFITKPFKIKELINRISCIINQKR